MAIVMLAISAPSVNHRQPLLLNTSLVLMMVASAQPVTTVRLVLSAQLLAPSELTLTLLRMTILMTVLHAQVDSIAMKLV